VLDQKTPRKNPVLKTRQPTLPPGARSRAALRLTAAACEGALELQRCRECGTFQYPPREACRHCLSVKLTWEPCSGDGELISETVLHHSNELHFREHLPVRVGLVRLREAVTVVAYVSSSCHPAPSPVRVSTQLDKAGQAALVARSSDSSETSDQDKVLKQMTCDPRGRKVLVTDGKSAVGQAVVKALSEAGASLIWMGVAEPWKKPPGLDAVAALPLVTAVALDVTDERSVEALATQIGAKVDIVVNTAEFHRTKLVRSSGTETARAEMDVNYLGLMRLIQHFAPALKGRAADGDANAVAWVNILSIYALSALPSQATFTASKAAAFALSQSLRADLQTAGIRVINAFPGPIDDEWNQLVQPPKLAPAALAAAIVRALKDGVEDIYPGDIAQDILARWKESAKVLERELADQ
jgi:NAD(P)-dependent dehydrogenase (short-subunit alcohol dehydrogenase family)/uncharacterized OB-fold protein